MEEEKICAVCKKNATQKCSGCERVYYCSRQHQKSHWKIHAETCKAFKVSQDPVVGRHYVASRNIKTGEIVLRDEASLVSGPMHNSLPVCLNCYTVLEAEIATPCEKCGWPLCKRCKDHGSECEFTSTRRDDKVSITSFGYPHPSYQCISVIRALSLKTSDPKSYERLLSFEDHCDIMEKRSDLVFEEPTNVVRFVKRFFKVDDIPVDEIKKIVGILQVNGHEVPIAEPPYMAVYDLATFLEHSCRANCSKSFTASGGLVIHAAVPISKGEHISICYTDPLWGTANRRHHLSRTKFFDCTCDRCRDPSEFGTMFNAIKCVRIDCSGYMLPETFLTEKPMNFECKECATKLSHEKVEELLEKIGMDLSRITKNDVRACKEFLGRQKTVLHRNHFYNTDVSIALAQLIGQQQGGLRAIDDDTLSEKIELCNRLDDLLRILAPAENRIRGLILFEMHAALAEFSRRNKEADTIRILMDSRKCLLEARGLLRLEPEILPEGKIALRAERNLQEMNLILKRLTKE